MFYTLSDHESDEHVIVRRSPHLHLLQRHPGKLVPVTDHAVILAQRVGFTLDQGVEICCIDGATAVEYEDEQRAFTRADEAQLGAIADYYDGVSRGQRD